MPVAAVSPAVGHTAAANGGGHGAVQAASWFAGSEEPMPVEGVPELGVEGKGAGPPEGVPAAIAVEGRVEEAEEKDAVAVAAAAEEEGEEDEGEKWRDFYLYAIEKDGSYLYATKKIVRTSMPST
ncbi:unnamed protein product [Urochloa humidicola]